MERWLVEGFRVDEALKLGFLSALGEEFCDALSPPVPFELITPQDSYEVWWRAFGTEPNPAALAALTEPQINQLGAECAVYFECPTVTAAHVRLAVSRTLSRWPASPHGSRGEG
jgi:hypothetical protein